MAMAAATARSAWSACGNGAPKTAITASPTNCMTVPGLAEDRPVHRGPVRAELAGQLARIGVLGDRRVRPDVAHQHGHRDALGLADRPRLLPELLRQAARQQPGQRLALLFPVHDGLVQQPQPLDGALLPGGDAGRELQEHGLHLGVDGLRRHLPGRGDRLDGLALGDQPQQFLLGRSSPPGLITGWSRAADDRRVQRGAAAGHARIASASWLPSATRSLSR